MASLTEAFSLVAASLFDFSLTISTESEPVDDDELLREEYPR